MSQVRFKKGRDAFDFAKEHRLRPLSDGDEAFYGLLEDDQDGFRVVIASPMGDEVEVACVSLSERRPRRGDLVCVQPLKGSRRSAHGGLRQKYVIKAVLMPRLTNGIFPEMPPPVETTSRLPRKWPYWATGLAVVLAVLIVIPTLGQPLFWLTRSQDEHLAVLVLPSPMEPRRYDELEATPLFPIAKRRPDVIEATQLAYVEPAPEIPAKVAKHPVPSQETGCERAEGIDYLICSDRQVRQLHQEVQDIPGYYSARRFWCDSISDPYDLRSCFLDVAQYLLSRQ